MGEGSVQFRREFEAGVCVQKIDPAFCVIGRERAVKRRIYFDRVEKAAQVFERMQLARHLRRVDEPLPVRVRPACRADTYRRSA